MSETTEVGPARRNLLVLTSVLLIIEVTGATIKSINAPAVSIEIQRPEFIIWFLYLTLAYLMFRFWQLAKETHHKHSQFSNEFIAQCTHVKRQIDQSYGDEVADYNGLSAHNSLIARGLFERTLTTYVRSATGSVERLDSIKLAYVKLFLPELIADLRAVPIHKDFVEYTFPFLYANAVIVLKAVLLFNKFILN